MRYSPRGRAASGKRAAVEQTGDEQRNPCGSTTATPTASAVGGGGGGGGEGRDVRCRVLQSQKIVPRLQRSTEAKKKYEIYFVSDRKSLRAARRLASPRAAAAMAAAAAAA